MHDSNKQPVGSQQLNSASGELLNGVSESRDVSPVGEFLVPRPGMRIATVQHGDFNFTRLQLLKGNAETYYGQQQTVDAMWRLVGGCPHLFVGLGLKPQRETAGPGQYVAPGEPPRIPGLPRRFQQSWYARRIIRELRAFKPTHLLLRCNDVVGCELLAWANKRGIPTIALIAATLDPGHRPSLRLCELANRNNVSFVANHNRVSAESLVRCGLQPEKALAWDYIHSATPDQYSVKTLPTSGELSVVFAGSLSPAKGVADVVAGCRQARASGLNIRLTVCGAGPLLEHVRSFEHEGWLEATGSVSQQEVLRRMRRSQVVVVASHHSFPEGLPLVLYEGLATRTPIVLSDHPVFQRYFENDRGVRFFTAGSSQGLAAALQGLLLNPAAYARLSEQTEEVWNSVQCSTKFHHVVERIAAEWQFAPAATPGSTTTVPELA
jgi:glycosyltransferase involved in cell wall biosynthesis